MSEWDPELAECLRLYGDEEGWHRELLTQFLAHLGGAVRPMGRVTGTFYRLYGRAKRYDEAIKWYEDALKLTPNDVNASTDLVVCYYYNVARSLRIPLPLSACFLMVPLCTPMETARRVTRTRASMATPALKRASSARKPSSTHSCSA